MAGIVARPDFDRILVPMPESAEKRKQRLEQVARLKKLHYLEGLLSSEADERQREIDQSEKAEIFERPRQIRRN